MRNILDFNINELKIWMKENNESEFRAKQVFNWIYRGIWEFNNMKNISNSTIQKLNDAFYVGVPKKIESYESKNAETTKFLLKYNDGNIVECVIMKYKYGNSICVSTQVGCRMGCGFCASTVGGMIRNLTAGEMLGEILRAEKETGERVSNVVLMGSGEPLDNYDNVIKFIELINSDYGLNIGQRHITLSTCGIVPKIKELAELNMQITLAISLHAPDDELRKTMMPIANKYSIEELMDVCKYYIVKTNRRITFEYALIKGVNDTREHAEKLSSILKGMLCHVNLIPVNAARENSFKRSSTNDIDNFSNILGRCGIETTVRREMGTDINAACGQLRRSYISTNNK